MKTNATANEIKNAVMNVSKRYESNIAFDRMPDPIPGTNLTRFTLKTKTPNSLGSKGITSQVSLQVTEEVMRELFKINSKAYVWNSAGKFVKGFKSRVVEPTTVNAKPINKAKEMAIFVKKYLKKDATKLPQFNELISIIKQPQQHITA